jgi:hypothetical protein
MEFEVLLHPVDVVENVIDDPRNDACAEKLEAIVKLSCYFTLMKKCIDFKII